jgi:hypothetical protein
VLITKQHYFHDAIGGLLLGAMAVLINKFQSGIFSSKKIIRES